MARASGPKRVQCYHCGHRFEVSARAQSTSCPECNKSLIVADLILKGSKLIGPKREERTCGKIVVPKKARLIAEFIEAHGGIEIEGTVESEHVISGQTVKLGPKSLFAGTLEAPSVIVAPGARIRPSMFKVPSDPKGLDGLSDPIPETQGPDP